MTIVDVFFTLLLLLGLVYLGWWRFKIYRMEKFRQSVFALRDELFDYAAHGKIDFNHPAYITLRSLMNGYIRFSHRISLLQTLFLMSFWSDRAKLKSFESVWQEVTADLNAEVKQDLEFFNIRASAHLFSYVFLSSLIKKLFVIPCIIFLLLKHFITTRVVEGVVVKESKSKDLEIATYQITTKNSEQIEHSIAYLNTDALAFGSAKASVFSV